MLEHHLQSRPGRTVKLMERSIYSARYCFVENMHKSGVMEGSEFEVLDQWYNFATGESGLDIGVDLIIYLRTTPEKALERMKERNRGEEAGVPLDYLKELHNLHEDWLVHKKHPVPAPVLVINADMVRHQFLILVRFWWMHAQGMEEMEEEYRRHEPKVFGVIPTMEERLVSSMMKGKAIQPMAPAAAV